MEPKLQPQVDEVRADRVEQLIAQFQPLNVPYERRIFVNRTLRMGRIKLIGYDMDYTLAEYHPAVEELAVRLTLDKLVHKFGYPAKILKLEYEPGFAIRGVIVDRRAGNLLKMDGHRHISVVFHGTHRLSKAERRKLYRRERVRMSVARYVLLDTLFAVPEAWLYAALVDFLDKRSRRKPKPEEYERLYDDIRTAIDEVHADQSLKQVICADLPTYIDKDPKLALSLHRLRASGKRLFLMTNSYAPYTVAVMSYLLDGERRDYASWKDYFDIIVVGSRKPAFFADGSEFVELGKDLRPLNRPVRSLRRGHIYQGGNLVDFERMAGASGDEVLYIGDNLYGDILRSKKQSTWRTAMIVPELEPELKLYEQLRGDFERRNDLETHRQQIDAELHQQQHVVIGLTEMLQDQQNPIPEEERPAYEHALEVAKRNVARLDDSLNGCLAEMWELNRKLESTFNPYWGMLFKSRSEHSIFGEQMEDYACVYTSRVSNFYAYSPFQYFRTPRDLLPHEHWTVEQTEQPSSSD